MKVISINGSMPTYHFGLAGINRIVHGILSELGIEVVEHNLALAHLPAYDGVGSDQAARIIEDIAAADGVVVSAVVSPGSVNASLAAFWEHLGGEAERGKNILANKNCLLVLLTRGGGGGRAQEYHTSVINYYKGFCNTCICLDASIIAGGIESWVNSVIEGQVEDYYRLLRQNRRFFIPFEFQGDSPAGGPAYSPAPETAAGPGKPVGIRDAGEFSVDQEQDIRDITELFSQRIFAGTDDDELTDDTFHVAARPGRQTAVTRERARHKPAALKKTKELPGRYINPVQGDGYIMQLNITGSGPFQGYLTITGEGCTYTEGQAQVSDITVMAEDAVWENVLKGTYTAQKAFMIGHLKVRGNFALLAKFDQLFSSEA